jgi:hypothetical protein
VRNCFNFRIGIQSLELLVCSAAQFIEHASIGTSRALLVQLCQAQQKFRGASYRQSGPNQKSNEKHPIVPGVEPNECATTNQQKRTQDNLPFRGACAFDSLQMLAIENLIGNSSLAVVNRAADF